jgi:hypothetical protein
MEPAGPPPSGSSFRNFKDSKRAVALAALKKTVNHMNSQKQNTLPENQITRCTENHPSPEELAKLFHQYMGSDGYPPRFHIDSAGRIIDRQDANREIDYDALASWAHDAVVNSDPKMAVRVLASMSHGAGAHEVWFGMETLDDDQFAAWAGAIVDGPRSRLPVYVHAAVEMARQGGKELLLALIRASIRAELDPKLVFGDAVLREFTADML